MRRSRLGSLSRLSGRTCSCAPRDPVGGAGDELRVTRTPCGVGPREAGDRAATWRKSDRHAVCFWATDAPRALQRYTRANRLELVRASTLKASCRQRTGGASECRPTRADGQGRRWLEQSDFRSGRRTERGIP